MVKILTGTIVSTKMTNTAVVEVTRRTPHKLYGKLLRRSKKYIVDTKGQDVADGQIVKIEETKPISKNKHFRILDRAKKGDKV